MIKSFADKITLTLFHGGPVRRVDVTIARAAKVKLRQIDAATKIEDLRIPAGNKLEKLIGDRAGQYSIRVNRAWRICFRFEDGNAYDAEFCNYHKG